MRSKMLQRVRRCKTSCRNNCIVCASYAHQPTSKIPECRQFDGYMCKFQDMDIVKAFGPMDKAIGKNVIREFEWRTGGGGGGERNK
jgi:hypothetical protein